MNDFKENEVTSNTASGEETVSETEAMVSKEENASKEETAHESKVLTDAPDNSENAIPEAAADTSSEVTEALSEEPAPVSDPSEPNGLSQSSPQAEQSGVFSEQSFVPGQAPHSAAAYYSEQPSYSAGQYGNAAFGNSQPYPQPMNNAQGGFGGQYNGQYAQQYPDRNANQYGGQYTGPYANGAPMYNYGYTPYNAQYNGAYSAPYYNPPKTPGIPAAPTAPAADEAAVKKPSKALIITVVLLIAAMLAGLMILLAVNHKNNGDKAPDSVSSGIDKALSEHESGKKDKASSGTGVTVNINVQSKPSDDESDYQDIEKGLYTTVGVAKHITPSIVTLYGYTTTTLTPYSAATGVILSEDGFIVTNAHMVEGLSRIKAVTYDEREFEAEIIGYEPWYDLAIIQIHADGLTPAELGSSDELMQGEQVVAIGNSGGYENTLTVGYVSYVNREIQSYSDYPIRCIQTDAAFNTGISGGALVNMYGQVVGIPTSKSVTDNDENIGFAIAMDFAVPICEDIIENGYVTWKPRVGVLYRMIDYDTAQVLGVRPGMLISEISEDCDISNTVLQVDDIITEMDGISMTTDEALIEFQTTHKAGDVVTATVYRRTITNEESEFEITFKLETAEG
ncbi:MAG: trypsin-like peptidase domain-containing protein [Oscillospiraceae bacterium]|nr:trypsin-like peptidase domain-containing protein [Oscillospiraceae bacterium]